MARNRSSRFLAVLCTALSAAVHGPAWTADAATARVAASRADAVAARIDASLAGSTETSRMLQGYSAEGTRVVAHARGADIRKIEVEALGERGKQRIDFYRTGGRLVAVHVRRIDYAAASVSGEAGGLPAVDTVVEDEWMSFEPGRPTSWRGLDGVRDVDTAEARERAAQWQDEARSFVGLMRMAEPARACLWSCARWGSRACVRYRCE